jgi:hypothetical protein
MQSSSLHSKKENLLVLLVAVACGRLGFIFLADSLCPAVHTVFSFRAVNSARL